MQMSDEPNLMALAEMTGQRLPTRSGCVEVTPCHRPGVIVTLTGSRYPEDDDEQIMGRLQEMFADLKVRGYVVDGRAVSVEVIR